MTGIGTEVVVKKYRPQGTSLNISDYKGRKSKKEIFKINVKSETFTSFSFSVIQMCGSVGGSIPPSPTNTKELISHV